MEIGIVSFFNIERGFGRIKTPEKPEGIFVHFTDVQGEARILVENELVQFKIKETRKGPKAEHVSRITERLIGRITEFQNGYGYIEENKSSKKYFIHHSDVKGQGFKKIEIDFEVEFSPFETERGLQAKEIIISDTRYPLEKFANLQGFERHLQKLAKMAHSEDWDYGKKNGKYSVLNNYLIQTFRRLQQEDKISYTRDQENKAYAAFNTGLVTDKQEELFAYFGENHRLAQPKSYIRQPEWQFKEFGRESHRLMSYFKRSPKLANYYASPEDLIYDTNRRLIPDYEHIVEDRFERFPDYFSTLSKEELISRLRNAILLAERMVHRNYKTAVPQYYEGRIQLLLPLFLEVPSRVDLALVVAKEHEIYRANTVLPLDWAYQNARLIAPPDRGWLISSSSS